MGWSSEDCRGGVTSFDGIPHPQGLARTDAAADLRCTLRGDVPLSPLVRAVLDAWVAGAPFGLALTGDTHRAETLFRALRPHAAFVVRRAEIDEPPPRAVRVLALWPDVGNVASALRRRCTVIVDVGAQPEPQRRPVDESETQMWRRVVATLAAHGVRDGAIDVAACALASALVGAGMRADPVALVRVWIAEPHGRALTAAGGSERGGADATTGADENEGPDAATANVPDAGDGGEGPEADISDAPDARSAGAEVDRAAGGDEADGEGPDSEGSDDAAPDAEAPDGTAGKGAEDAGDARGEEPAPAEGPTGEPRGDLPDHTSDEQPDVNTHTGADDDDATSASGGSGEHPSDPGAGAAPEGDDPAAAGFATDRDAASGSSTRALALAAPDLRDAPDRATVRAGRRARRGPRRAGTGRGRPGRVVAPERADGRIAVLPTLQRALQRHALSGAESSFVVTRDDLRGRLRADPVAAHTIVVIDGSSSMGGAGAAHARRVADVALAHVSRDRGEVSVVLAAGSSASVVQDRTFRVSRARAALQRAGVGAGGGTPLADAVRCALDGFGDAPRERCRLVIVSDGQATVDLAGRADPRAAARDLRAQLARAAGRTARCVFVPLDARGYAPLERTLAPFRAAGVEIAAD